MALSRREFVRRLGAGGAAAATASSIIGYGHEAFAALAWDAQAPAGARQAREAADIRLSSNENLRGPSPKVLEVLRQHPSKHLGLGYPPPNVRAFQEHIATIYGATPANVIVATGSDAILQAAVIAYASADRPVVTADPSYGTPVGTARRFNIPVKAVPVDAGLRLDLDAMIAASTGAGLVFICNPNNPTSTVHTLADVERAVRTIKKNSPETGILIDEAYIDYVTSPGAGSTSTLALELPGVFMARTFSKAYGMAGMRIGYAIGQPETIGKVGRAWGLGSLGDLQAVGGLAALKDTAHMDWERQENKRIREWTLAQFREMGYEAPESQTNFVFVNIRRPAAGFRDACRAAGVAIGRDFPPMEKTHARISLGTMEDMQRAMGVFRQALAGSSMV
ncbi:MAG: histidinol-phosphate transaminase [Acidobacteriota bacterium]